MEGTGNKNVEEFEAVAAGGLVLQRYLEKERAAYRQIQTEEELLEGFEGFVCQRDREILNGEFLEFQLTSCRLIAGDGIWGWYDDDLASWKPWNFDPAKISVPLSIWHGEDDLVLPIAEGKFLAKLMPDANPHWLPGQGHFSLYPDHFGEILDELIALGLTS
jgi:pimeloyl-ACP methyl ester carboxylesterase